MSDTVTVEINHTTRPGENGVPVFELRVACTAATGSLDTRIFLMELGDTALDDEFSRVCNLTDLFTYDNNRHDAEIQEDTHYRISNFIKEYDSLDVAIQAAQAVTDAVNTLMSDYNDGLQGFSGVASTVISGADATLLESLITAYNTAVTNLTTAETAETTAQEELTSAQASAVEQQDRVTKLKSSKQSIKTAAESLLSTDLANLTTIRAYGELTAPHQVDVDSFIAQTTSNRQNLDTNTLSTLQELIDQEEDLLASYYEAAEQATSDLTAASISVAKYQSEVDTALDAVLQLDPTFEG